MKKSELIQILESYPGDPEVIVELLDGETSVPIQHAALYENSSTPEIVHLITSLP